MLKAKHSNTISVNYNGLTVSIPEDAQYIFLHSARGQAHVCTSVRAPTFDNISYQSPDKTIIQAVADVSRKELAESLELVSRLTQNQNTATSKGSIYNGMSYEGPLTDAEMQAMVDDETPIDQIEDEQFLQTMAVSTMLDTLEKAVTSFKEQLMYKDHPSLQRFANMFHPEKGLIKQLTDEASNIAAATILQTKTIRGEDGEGCDCPSCSGEGKGTELPKGLQELLGHIAHDIIKSKLS